MDPQTINRAVDCLAHTMVAPDLAAYRTEFLVGVDEAVDKLLQKDGVAILSAEKLTEFQHRVRGELSKREAEER